jgi:hypothetical protein
MKWEIKYNTRQITNPFYGAHGNMMVRNSMDGVLIQHDKEIHEFQERALGQKVIADICNCLRSGYEPYLPNIHFADDRKVFTKFLDSKIIEAERKLNELRFAKKILSRKNIIFEKLEEIK